MSSNMIGVADEIDMG